MNILHCLKLLMCSELIQILWNKGLGFGGILSRRFSVLPRQNSRCFGYYNSKFCPRNESSSIFRPECPYRNQRTCVHVTINWEFTIFPMRQAKYHVRKRLEDAHLGYPCSFIITASKTSQTIFRLWIAASGRDDFFPWATNMNLALFLTLTKMNHSIEG